MVSAALLCCSVFSFSYWSSAMEPPYLCLQKKDYSYCLILVSRQPWSPLDILSSTSRLVWNGLSLGLLYSYAYSLNKPAGIFSFDMGALSIIFPMCPCVVFVHMCVFLECLTSMHSALVIHYHCLVWRQQFQQCWASASRSLKALCFFLWLFLIRSLGIFFTKYCYYHQNTW